MITCKNCGFENKDGSNFCANCGSSLKDQREEAEKELESPAEEAKEEKALTAEAEDGIQEAETDNPDEVIELEEAQTEEPEPEDADDKPHQEEKNWYYVENGQSRGPFEESIFEEMAANGTIREDTYIWTPGMENWQLLKDTDFGRNLMPAYEEAQKEPESEPVYENSSANDTSWKEESCANSAAAGSAASDWNRTSGPVNNQAEWFYIQNGRSAGPFTEDVMAQYIRSGVVGPNTYVWKDGIADWQFCSQSELARYLPQPQNTWNNQSYQPGSGQSRHYGAPVYALRPRSIVLYIILTLVTCGLFSLYWIYCIAKDVDALAEEANRPRGIDPVLSVVLSIVTCGLFQIYFFYKEGAVLAGISRNGYSAPDQSILLAILALLCEPAAAAILQDQINALIEGR